MQFADNMLNICYNTYCACTYRTGRPRILK